MTRRSVEPMTRIHIWLPNRTIEELKMLYGEHPGFSKSIQMILTKFLAQVNERATLGSKLPEVEDVE